MQIKEFIEAAIEGGWQEKDLSGLKLAPFDYFDPESGKLIYRVNNQISRWVLDPELWEAVGKVKGWEEKSFVEYDLKESMQRFADRKLSAQDYQTGLIRALWEGKTLQEYIETL